MILQLNPPIHVSTPLGEGDALLVIDYSCHLNSVWVVWLFDDGRVNHFDSSDIRVMGTPCTGSRTHRTQRARHFLAASPAIEIKTAPA